MSFRTTLVWFLHVLAAFCSGLELEDDGFSFIQEEYARAITEYHAVNKTVMHIRAVGCHNKPVQYTIREQDTPFTIDEKGHIILVKPLNTDKTDVYLLHVKATSGNGKCVATTTVLFEILNKNKHAPQFEFEEYYCSIVENSRELRISPPLKVTDADHGDAGKVKNVTIVEGGLPFVFTVADDGTVQGRATEGIDAEEVTDYFFDVIASDNGRRPRRSYPVSLECEVEDVNEFAPQFLQDSYQATIFRGRAYENIIQVSAGDKDIGLTNGKVCEYIIEGLDLPFTISEKGVISLNSPLGEEAYALYEFKVDAVDCGKMMSLTSAQVSIRVETPCHKEFIEPTNQELVLQQCTGKVYVTPNTTLNECAAKQRNAHFSANVTLETNAGMGCDRETFEASDSYTICGADDFINLLPEPGTGREWTKKLVMKGKKHKGEKDGFYFDGKTYVEIPENVVPDDIGDKFTISTWIKMNKAKGQQTIIANTDKERLDRVHFSLSTSGAKLLFVHRREAIHASRDLYCNAEFQYKPEIFDFMWHHIAVIVDGCSAKLYIDGVHQQPVISIPDWTLHKSTMKNMLTVGARYLAKEKVYSEKFSGYLSGLVIKPNSVLNGQVLQCVTRCREHVNVEGPLPENFFAKTIDFGQIEISGEGTPEDFVKVLNNVVYVNERLVPTPGKRTLKISTKINQEKLADIRVAINVAGNTRPVIVVKGLDSDIDLSWEKRNLLKETGLQIFDTLEIEYDGCEIDDETYDGREIDDGTPVDKVRYLDRAVVTVDPPFKKGESFIFPQGILGLKKQKGLSVSYTNKELVIRGVAHFSEYENVLRETVYSHQNPAYAMDHKFAVSVSTLNGRCLSDKELRRLSVIHKNRELEKYNIHAVKSNLEEKQLPGFVSMEGGFDSASSDEGLGGGVMALIIVCSLAVFIVLVVIGIYKYRQRPATVKVNPPGDENADMYWDDTGLSGVRITLNPMQKFQELDLNEDGANTDNAETEDEEGGATKGLLEWDNSDI